SAMARRASGMIANMIWVSRALAAAIVLIGPALLAFARSDLGPWSSRPEQIFLAAPFALQAFGAFGYVVAAVVTRADVSATRTVIAAMGCLLIPYATMALASPLLAFLSVQGTKLALAAALAVLALPTAVFQVLTMGRKRPLAKLEFLSHPYATSGPFLFDSMLPLLEHGGGERIFQAWPVLLALAPFVALAAAGATAVPLRRLAFGCVVAAIPIYAGMTALHAGDGAAAALWPVRVWTDFIGTSERLALIRTVTTVRP